MASVRKLREALLAWLTDQATSMPTGIYRVLLPHERRNLAVRQHPAILFGPLALALTGFIVAGLLSSALTPNNTIEQLSIWLVWLIFLLYLLLRVLDWLGSFFVVTSLRIILATGSVQAKIDIIPLDQLDGVTLKQSLLGRLLGYGSFVVAFGAPSQLLQKIDYIPDPEDLYVKISDALFAPRKVPCPECQGEGAIWMRSGQESLQIRSGQEPHQIASGQGPFPVLRDENSEVEIALGSAQSFKELLESGFERVKCDECNGEGVVDRDSV